MADNSILIHRPVDPVKLRREWHFRIQPFLRMKAEIMLKSPFSISLKHGEISETVYPPETLKRLAEIDDLMKHDTEQWLTSLGVDLPPSTL